MTVERQIRELLDSGSLFEEPPGADPDVILAEMLLGEQAPELATRRRINHAA